MPAPQSHPTVGVVIRFKNSAATLPAMLAALRRQTVQPGLMLGVNNGSTDGSVALMQAAGAKIVDWTEPYSHPRVLNFAVRHCPTDLVLVLSSHTVLNAPDALEQFLAAMSDPQTACVSARWDGDPFYSDAITWAELQAKGLKFGSIYSNSMGMFRRSLWEQAPFDEAMPTMEDNGWALEQIKRGYGCRRVRMDFSYNRGGADRSFVFAVVTFQLAARHGLFVTWLGPVGALKHWLRGGGGTEQSASAAEAARLDARQNANRLRAWLTWRWQRKVTE